MKLSIFDMTYNLTQKARLFFKEQPSADDCRAFIDNHLKGLNLDQKTSKGYRRYPKKYAGELFRLWLGLKEMHTLEHCVFGYWYEGEFYTTYKNAPKSLKTTEYLHNLEPRLTSAQWDSLENGMYYKDTLKKHY